jgi:hypothetical protein
MTKHEQKPQADGPEPVISDDALHRAAQRCVEPA